MEIPYLKDFEAFGNEREAIRVRKESGQPWPWTTDPILRDHYFCNVRREDDKVTRWLAANWRAPHADDSDLWFALTVFRRGFNNPNVGEELGYASPWNPNKYLAIYNRRQSTKLPFLRPAYMTPGPAGKSGGNVTELQVQYIFNSLWANRAYVRPRPDDTLASFYARLDEQYCCGGFYAAQVVADLKYAQLKDAQDWWTFVVSGPGSRRGLNRILGRNKDARWKEREWVEAFRELEAAVTPLLPMRLHSQDLQNAICEWDKRERVRSGEGRVREYRPEPRPGL